MDTSQTERRSLDSLADELILVWPGEGLWRSAAQDPRLPYDFPADVYSLGCILTAPRRRKGVGLGPGTTCFVFKFSNQMPWKIIGLTGKNVWATEIVGCLGRARPNGLNGLRSTVFSLGGTACEWSLPEYNPLFKRWTLDIFVAFRSISGQESVD